MNELIYERMAEAGFLQAGQIRREEIVRAPVDKLINLVLEISTITSAEYVQRDNAPFVHSASMSLIGSRYPCESIDCRIERIHELMQFAVLYSDRVYVKNILADHIYDIDDMVSNNEELFRERLTDDLIILNKMRPVIEKGFIIPFTPPLNRCPHCLAEQSFGQDGKAKLMAIEDYIRWRYYKEVSVELLAIADQFILTCRGPESLLEHGGIGLALSRNADGSIPPSLRQINSIVRRAEKGEEVLLSPAAKRKVGIIEDIAEREIASICFELFTAQSFGTSFLTDRPVHIDALDISTQDNELERRNSIARKHLTSLLPFISGVPIDDLISIREAESDAFILYRRALNEAIDEYRTSRSDFSEKDARMLYADVIAPKLTILNQTVKSTRRTLLKRTGTTVVVWAGAITFGVYSGLVPPDLIKAAQALGLTHIVVDLLRSAAVGLDPTENIRGEDLYFLWKVRKKHKQ